jgi:hypothetical protein
LPQINWNIWNVALLLSYACFAFVWVHMHMKCFDIDSNVLKFIKQRRIMIFGSMSYLFLIHFSLFICCLYFDLIHSCLILFDQWRGSKLPVSPNHWCRPTSSSRCQLSVVQLRLSLFQIWCHHRRQNHATVLWEPEDTTENYIRSSVSLNGHNPGDIIPNLFGEIYLSLLIIVCGAVILCIWSHRMWYWKKMYILQSRQIDPLFYVFSISNWL